MPKNLKILFISRIFSGFSGAMYPVALPLYILKLSGSLAISGLFFTLVMLPQMFLMPIIGVCIETRSKKMVTDISLAILCFLAFTEFLLLQFSQPSLTSLGLISAIISLLFSVIELSTKILFSEIVPKDKLEKYNGLKSVWDNLAAFGAPMIATLIYGFLGFKIVALIIAVFYFIASMVLIKLSDLSNLNYQNKVIQRENNFFSNLKSGMTFIKENKAIRNFYLLASTLNFFLGSQEEIINPSILMQKYHISEKLFGLVSLSFTLGVMVSGLLLEKYSKGNTQNFLKYLFIINSVIMMLIGILSVLFSGRYPVTFLISFLFLEFIVGFVTILVNVPLTAYFQSAVPINYQGRVFALLSFISGISVPLGISYSGFIASKIGADWTYIINNLFVIIIVLIVFRRKDKGVN